MGLTSADISGTLRVTVRELDMMGSHKSRAKAGQESCHYGCCGFYGSKKQARRQVRKAEGRKFRRDVAKGNV